MQGSPRRSRLASEILELCGQLIRNEDEKNSCVDGAPNTDWPALVRSPSTFHDDSLLQPRTLIHTLTAIAVLLECLGTQWEPAEYRLVRRNDS